MSDKTSNNPAVHHRYLADDDEHEAYSPVGMDGILAATEKLLAVNRGLTDPDDRDSLPNDRVHTVDKMIAERVKLDHGRTLRSMMGRLSRAKTLAPLGADTFGDYSVGFIKSNPLVPALEEINPMHILEQKRRITKMGPGGIGDPNAITEDMNAVSATQFGFVDPVAGPECWDDKTMVLSYTGWVEAAEVTEDHLLACDADGCLEFKHPTRIHKYHYDGYMIGMNTGLLDFLVTPGHRLWHRKASGVTWRFDLADDLYGENIGIDVSRMPRSGMSVHGSHANSEEPTGGWYKKKHQGFVYCVTIEGGMVFTRRGCGIGHWTGNSEKAGIDVRLSHGTRVGSDGRIYQLLVNRKTGKKEWVSPSDLRGKTLKLPD